MDLDALREAVEWVEPLRPGRWVGTLAAAGRAVLDSEEVWWCETHGHVGTSPTVAEICLWKKRGDELGVTFPPCFMVRARVLIEGRT